MSPVIFNLGITVFSAILSIAAMGANDDLTTSHAGSSSTDPTCAESMAGDRTRTVNPDIDYVKINPPETRNKINGRYVVIGELARGGQGIVYRAYDEKLGREVVLKFSLKSHRDTVVAEGRAIAQVRHDNINVVLEVEDGDEAFLVLDPIEGINLDQWRERGNGSNWAMTVKLMLEVCDGLSFAHGKNILHRDLKPANIRVKIAPEREPVAVIIDFGLAATLEDLIDKAGVIEGSPYYMAPEQARGGTIDQRTDIYGLGAVLFYLLTGNRPVAGNSVPEILAKVDFPEHSQDWDRQLNLSKAPRLLKNIARKAMAKKPENRFQTVEEFAAALRGVYPKGFPWRRVAAAATVTGSLASYGLWSALVPNTKPVMPPPRPAITSEIAQLVKFGMFVIRPEGAFEIGPRLPLRAGDKIAVTATVPKELDAVLVWAWDGGFKKIPMIFDPTAKGDGRVVRYTYPQRPNTRDIEGGTPGSDLFAVIAFPPSAEPSDFELQTLLPDLGKLGLLKNGLTFSAVGPGPLKTGTLATRAMGAERTADGKVVPENPQLEDTIAALNRIKNQFGYVSGRIIPHVKAVP